jgi:hypothetical protein
MTRSRKLLLVIIALALLADFLPVTREELAWWWAQSHDHSVSYSNYLSQWPHGRHMAEAKNLLEERLRAEIKRAEIRRAYAAASQAKSDTDAAYRHQQQLRKDSFFWKQASTANTIESYNDYLREFPQGGFSAQARKKIQDLTPAPSQTNK